MAVKVCFVALALACLVALVASEAWDSQNDPSNMGNDFTASIAKLPLNATLATTPWSDTYWPSKSSGIAHRWKASNPNDFNYKTNTLDQLKAMSHDDLAALSPAEKYDIYKGRYDYPTVQSEWQRTSPQDAGWEGLCHGWSPAAYSYQQPGPVTLNNSDGISVPFGSSDVKALLTYYLAEYADGFETDFAGRRCNTDIDQSPDKANITECADINAGAFHIILANKIGIKQSSFVFDRERSIQVWNQPLSGYSMVIGDSRPPSDKAAPGTAKQVNVATHVQWVGEMVPEWEAHESYVTSLEYHYWLDVDANGNIIGGQYDSYERPDFVWFMAAGEFSDYFADAKTVYNASIKSSSARPLTPAKPFAFHASVAQQLNTKSGSFSSSKKDGVATYANNQKESWLITPNNGGAKTVSISFSAFETERYHDKVRIFEVDSLTNQKGALVAVLHGDLAAGHTITVKGSSAYVTFTTDDLNTKPGFAASFVGSF